MPQLLVNLEGIRKHIKKELSSLFYIPWSLAHRKCAASLLVKINVPIRQSLILAKQRWSLKLVLEQAWSVFAWPNVNFVPWVLWLLFFFFFLLFWPGISGVKFLLQHQGCLNNAVTKGEKLNCKAVNGKSGHCAFNSGTSVLSKGCLHLKIKFAHVNDAHGNCHVCTHVFTLLIVL